MADDFYPFVDSGDPAPDNQHLPDATPAPEQPGAAPSEAAGKAETAAYATRISVYDDLYATPRVIVIEPGPVRSYLEEVTNTVYRAMKEQGGAISLMVIREIVENFIHAHFVEPIISILDGGNTIRFADQGPGIADKERAFEFGVTSANRSMKRYIRGTGSGLPMVQQYLEAAGGAVSIENNLGGGTVVTVSTDPKRVLEIKRAGGRGAAVRPVDERTQGAASAAQPGPWEEQMANPAAQPWGEGAGAPQGWQGAPGAPVDQQQPPVQPPAYGGPYPAPYGTGYPQPYANQYPYQNPYANPYAPAAGGYPAWPTYPSAPGWKPVPGYSQPSASFPQTRHEFSTMPAPGPQPARSPLEGDGAAIPAGELIVSERGRLALSYLLEHGHAGPSELTEAYGQSGPTWSRELATLGKRGFTVKQGQKYYLTELGASWARSHS